jgi:hypothetical protein
MGKLVEQQQKEIISALMDLVEFERKWHKGFLLMGIIAGMILMRLLINYGVLG